MKLYVKCLMLNADRRLSSCNGGTLEWEQDTVYPNARPGSLCAAGYIHACRMKDVPQWIATHNVIIEVDGPVVEGPDKVGVLNARIVRAAPEVDGLMMLADFAEYVAGLGAAYSVEKVVEWLKGQYPAGFFDGVEA